MLRKINSNYQGRDVTVDEIQQQVKFLKKLRIPFIGVTAFNLTLQITLTSLETTFIISEAWSIWLWYSYALAYWIVLGASFLVYGRKLASLMPLGASKKLLKVVWQIESSLTLTKATHRITTYSIVALFGFGLEYLIAALNNVSYGDLLHAVVVCYLVLVPLANLTLTYGSLLMFIRTQKNFPFIIYSDSSSKSPSTGSMSVINMQNTQTNI